MTVLWSYFLAFLGGGVLLTPLIFLVILFFLSRWWRGLPNSSDKSFEEQRLNLEKRVKECLNPDDLEVSQAGWLRMTKEFTIQGDGSDMVGLMQCINSYIDQGSKRSKNLIYAILKRETLWLYNDEKLTNCQGVLTLSQFEVTIFPKHLPDNEIFHKELPIRLLKKCTPSAEDDQVQFFFFVCTPSAKEDWFMALLNASKMKRRGVQSSTRCNPLDFDTSDIDQLIDILHNNDHHKETLWLNAFIGRVFLSIYKTPEINHFFIRKILAKIEKLHKPSFLDEIKIHNLDIGTSIPTITHPKLAELSKTGELQVEFFMNYRGKLRLEIETEVNAYIPLLRPRKLQLGLGLALKELSGRMVLHMKAPPTNRFWLSFCSAPSVSLELEPEVCGKQLKSPLIIQLMEKAIMGVIKNALVLPNMSDFPFLDSLGAGGIFKCAPEFIYKPDNQTDVPSAKPPEDYRLPLYGRRRSSSTSRDEVYSVDTDTSSIFTTKTHSSFSTNDSNDSIDYETPKIYLNGDMDQYYLEEKPLSELNTYQFNHKSGIFDVANGYSNTQHLSHKSSFAVVSSKSNSLDSVTNEITSEGASRRSSNNLVAEYTSQNEATQKVKVEALQRRSKKAQKHSHSKRKNLFGHFFNHKIDQHSSGPTEEESPRLNPHLSTNSISSLVLSTHNALSRNTRLEKAAPKSI